MSAEIEAEVRELPELPAGWRDGERTLVVARPDTGIAATGALALAALSDDEFDRRLGALAKSKERVERIQRALMTRDVDFGLIPGTPKPTLLKPGAEKLCLAYGLAADFAPVRTIGDGQSEPWLSYVTRCELHLGSLDGPVVAVGYGAANSWERRYRYRMADRACPNCGQPAIIKGKAEYGGGWVCFKKKGGCGSKWPDGAPEIEGQEVGQVDNPDPFDLDVTLAKMAEKRAHVDATLRATAASGLFTQDMEDRPPELPPDPPADPETGEVIREARRRRAHRDGRARQGRRRLRVAPDPGRLRDGRSASCRAASRSSPHRPTSRSPNPRRPRRTTSSASGDRVGPDLRRDVPTEGRDHRRDLPGAHARPDQDVRARPDGTRPAPDELDAIAEGLPA
jgi:hypothetical protein